MPDSFDRSLPLAVLAGIAAIAALHFAEGLAAPLALAFVTGMILSPVNSSLRRLRVTPTLAALLTLAGSAVLIGIAALLFRPWIIEVIEAWPNMRFEIQKTLIDIRVQLSGLFDIQREVMSAIDPAGAANGGSGSSDSVPTLGDAAWLAPKAMGQALLFAGGLFFFLIGKDDLYDTVSGPRGFCPDGACAAAETRVARYFGTVALINLGFGAAVALALSLIGVPAAPLWGVVAALANFVIYLGAAMTAAALLIAGTVSFDGLTAFLPAAVFVTLNAIEGQFVTPTLLGRQMRLNPLLVFVSLAFWLWLWGPIGGIVAIPLLLWSLEIWDALRGQSAA